MTTTSLPCTCHVPTCVELNSSPTSKALLLKNLRQLGWSPVRWEKARVAPPTADGIRSLFCNSPTNQNKSHPLHYRSQESGGRITVEPKESLELEQSQIHDNDGHATSLEYQLVKDWCLTLSKIAHVVNQLLDIPPNVLLVNDDADEDDDTNDNNDSNKNQKDRLDLLRVFYYHQVQNRQDHDGDPPCFGSSPHTDWGSWTVVWQDSVGGLESFCRSCQKWNPVAPPPASPNTGKANITTPTPSPSNHHHTWNCIIHVGDLASLALGKEQQQQQPVHHCENTTLSAGDPPAGRNHEGVVQWPSPRHRVVSPTHTTRTSLVYFAYPPPSLSLAQLQEALVDWENPRGLRLPLSEYYLLQDQSSSIGKVSNKGCNDHEITEEEQATASYELLRELSIRDVIHTKWAQVQRESDDSP